MRWGLTIPVPGIPLAAHEPLVRRAEALGYEDLWSAETNGPDGFTPLALAATWTSRARLATGVVNPYTRGLPVLAQHAAALADISQGRFVLGLGASSDRIVQGWNGIPFEKPLTRVREAVSVLRPVLAGERGPGGFRLDPAPAHPIPIVVAALRARMARLAGAVADGVFLNLTPVSGVREVVAAVREGERAAGRAAGSCEIACRFFCLPQPAEDALGLARMLFAAYGSVPVYAAFFRSLGWGPQLDPMVEAWDARDRERAVALAPEALLREIFLIGSAGEQREQLARFEAEGVQTASLVPLCSADEAPRFVEEMAPV